MECCSGENAVRPEDQNKPDTEATQECVDTTGECAGLSIETKNLLSLNEQDLRPSVDAFKEETSSTAFEEAGNSSHPRDEDTVDIAAASLPVCLTSDSVDNTSNESVIHCEAGSFTDSEGKDNYEGITLIDLPTEVILQLCSYLDSRFLINTLRLVCRRFYSILSDDFIWRSRIMRKWTQLYPAIPTTDEESVDWRDACLHLEDQRSLWSNRETKMQHTTWKNTHYSCVNSVILINDGAVCVSGSRDFSLAVWDVENFREQPLAHVGGHKRWVWRLAADSKSTFYSGSFDNTLKHWTLEQDLRSTSSYDCNWPVMSIASVPNFAAVALQNNQVCLFDPRAFNAPVSTYNLAKGFALVLGIICDNGTPDLVVSGAKNGYVSVWDIRAGKILKDIPKAKSKAKPAVQTLLSMSLQKDSCYFGDSKGQLHLMDPRRASETAFEIVATYEPGHKEPGKINALSHGKGHLFTGGSDGFVYVFSPTHDPEIITSFQLETEISCMDYQNNILVVGCDTAVEAYKPITPL